MTDDVSPDRLPSNEEIVARLAADGLTLDYSGDWHTEEWWERELAKPEDDLDRECDRLYPPEPEDCGVDDAPRPMRVYVMKRRNGGGDDAADGGSRA
ncbi:hypothetical protein ACLUWO_05020 [Pseudoscardovia radai]|uniref:hypothetical protein n=1 Tax=Pseudoscardovia radai TaxID=987066 RepID=UPI0039914529